MLVGIGAGMLSIETSTLLHIPFISIKTFLLITAGSIAYYCLHDIIDPNESGEKGIWLREKKYISVGFFLLFGLIAFILSMLLPFLLFTTIILVALISTFYFLKVLPFKTLTRFKDQGLFKTISLSVFWVIATVYLPLSISKHQLFNKPVTSIALHRFLLLFVTAIVFDIRDLKEDIIKKVYTLAYRYNRSLKWIFVFILLLYSTNAFFSFSFIESSIITICALIIAVIGWPIFKTNFQYWRFAAIDAIFILQPLLLIANYNL